MSKSLTPAYQNVAQELQRVARMDAAHSLFIARELEDLDSRLFDKLYAKTEFMQLVPSSVSVNIGAEDYSYTMLDRVGEAMIDSDYNQEAPTVDVSRSRETSKIHGLRAAFQYSIQEARAAAMANLPLEASKAFAARDMIERKLNTIMLNGDSGHSLEGLFALSALTIDTTSLADNTLAWTDQTTNTGILVAQDVIRFCNKLRLNSLGNHQAKKLVLPEVVRLDFMKRPLDASTPNKSVMQYIQENLPGMEVVGSFYLDTAGASSDRRALVMDTDPKNIQMVLPVPMEMLPEEIKPSFVRRELHSRVGGVVCRYSASALYIDGI